MPEPILGGALLLGGGLLSSGAQSRAANRAVDAQSGAAEQAIAEQRFQFDEMRRLLQPYVNAGDPALRGMLDLAGLGTEQSQADAIREQEESPLFEGLYRQGENAIMQNASATGGLRGGNIKGALAQFRPALLNDFISQQYGRLTGIAQIGQNAAAGVGAQGINTGNMIAQQYGNIGAAQAGGALARGQAQANLFQLPAQFLGMAAGLGRF
jgi:hypothetical protein